MKFFNFPIKIMSETTSFLAKHGMCNYCGDETRRMFAADPSREDEAVIASTEQCSNCGRVYLIDIERSD